MSSQPLLEDVPEHPVDRRDVGAGPHPHVLGRVRGGARHPRIDHDHVGAVELLAFENVLQRHRMRLGRIAAHHHDGPGVADVVVAVGHRAVAPGVGHAGDGGGVTDARLVIGVVGSPEGGELAVEIGGLVGELGGAEPVDRFRARLGADLHQLVADLVDRLIPRHADPLAVHELHRIAQPALAQHVVAHRRALAAVRAAIDRAVPARLLTDPHAVRDFGDDGAADRAMGADVLADRHGCARRRRRAGLGLAYARQRQRSERRQAAGSEARTAQEGTTIDAAIGLRRQRGGQRGAARLAFGPLHQHGCLRHFAG